ncbi:MAG: ABC transporter substrate-binding protein [Sutterellaceae bacterium]|nr:ABC transporter substrate-binding protein [Burkholderiaceae bacterium]MCX7901785.1 ABC transporter substrate-binding protein [Burkholderiaceae bacterium]MDW8429160.1 ABC transporter substrate-binding protein [Sutterellaceae bacterium]
MRKLLLAAFAACTLLGADGASGKTLRWASQGDILTMDPHAQNEGLNNTAASYVYEPLITYDEKFQLAPALAVSWRQETPLIWRFELRKGVKFHDGTPFTAADAEFSIMRAMAPTSNFRVYTTGIERARALDEHTLLIITAAPNPVLLRQLTELRIMSKAWAEKHNVVQPQNFVQKEETYAARHANGTGPFMLKSREVDVRTVFVENPNWWGRSSKKGNVTEIIYTPIKSDATRTAALLSGEIDFVLDPAPQDIARLKANPNIKVVEGTENRTIFIGLDQHRDELLYADVKGKNPFKDLRVRQALYHAIDIEAIKRSVMRGLSDPTGAIIQRAVNGWTEEAHKRLPYDERRARELLAAAGYPNGFSFTLDCPNNRYINDEDICKALAAMWARIGLKVNVNAMPRATYFPKIQKYDTSAYLLGWGVPTFDALYTLQSLARTVGQGGDGNFNLGRVSNPEFDRLVDAIKTEIDTKKRNDLIARALLLHNREVMHIPLHNQVIPWAMRKNVNVVHRADNRLEARWVRID